ncbi:NUDIX domain-containing protein [Echinicola sediminis]
MMGECCYRISVKALIEDSKGDFLLIKEDNGLWDLPGGGLDHGESAQEGIIRELMEEMGIIPSFVAEQPLLFFTCINPKGEQIANIVYRVELPHLAFKPSPECMEIKFFSPDEDLEQFTYPNVPLFAQVLKKFRMHKK